MTATTLRRDAAFNLEELQTLVAELVELYAVGEHHPSTIYLEPIPIFALEEEALTDGSKVLNLRVTFREEALETPPASSSSSRRAELEQIATDCMESTAPSVADWHRVAGNAAETTACADVAIGDRIAYRQAEAEALLKAVRAHDPNLTTAERLLVAAMIAARAAD